MRLAIIILNYRTPELVIDCLESLAAEREAVEFDAVVVDNASGDGSAERIGEAIGRHDWGRWARVLESPVNGGFSAGNNFGIRAIEADLYLLLNSDTVVRAGALAALLDAAQSNPRAGLINPRLEFPDGTPQISMFRWMRPRTELIRAACTGLITRLLKSADTPIDVSGMPMEAEWACFAAVLIRREVIEQIGLLDEGYFMYFEDVDYSRRAVEAGWTVLYWPRARVVHLIGSSSPVESLGRQKKRRPAYYYASRARYYAKFYGRFGLWRANMFWMLGRCISIARELLQRRPRVACRSEWRDNWINALRPVKPPEDRQGQG